MDGKPAASTGGWLSISGLPRNCGSVDLVLVFARRPTVSVSKISLGLYFHNIEEAQTSRNLDHLGST